MIVEKKPVCKLIGTDGNVFALAGRVTSCLKREGMRAEAEEFQKKLFSCGSYDEALALMSEYVEIE